MGNLTLAQSYSKENKYLLAVKHYQLCINKRNRSTYTKFVAKSKAFVMRKDRVSLAVNGIREIYNNDALDLQTIKAIASLYIESDVIQKSYQTAIAWYQKAQKHHFAEAYNDEGLIHLNIFRNYLAAIQCFQNAINLGFHQAEQEVAGMLANPNISKQQALDIANYYLTENNIHYLRSLVWYEKSLTITNQLDIIYLEDFINKNRVPHNLLFEIAKSYYYGNNYFQINYYKAYSCFKILSLTLSSSPNKILATASQIFIGHINATGGHYTLQNKINAVKCYLKYPENTVPYVDRIYLEVNGIEANTIGIYCRDTINDSALALRWFEKSVDLNYSEASFHLGCYYESINNLKGAIFYYQYALNNNYALAKSKIINILSSFYQSKNMLLLFQIANLYFEGARHNTKLIEHKYDIALKCYDIYLAGESNKSSKDFYRVLINMGIIFCLGEDGVGKDFLKAVKYFQQAAELDNADQEPKTRLNRLLEDKTISNYELLGIAMMYYYGKGVIANQNSATIWLSKIQNRSPYINTQQFILFDFHEIELIKKLRDVIAFQYNISISGHPLLFLGPTGAGKSTLINYLLGCRYHSADDKSNIKLRDGSVSEKVSVGHNNVESETLQPNIRIAKIAPETHLFFCDLQGFDDTRGEEAVILGTCASQHLIQYFKQAKIIIFTIDYYTLQNRKYAGLKEAFIALNKMLSTFNDLTLQNVIFVITKNTDLNYLHQFFELLKSLSNSFVKKTLSGDQKVIKTFCDYFLKNDRKVMQMNVIDEGECASLFYKILQDSMLNLEKNSIDILRVQKETLSLINLFEEKLAVFKDSMTYLQDIKSRENQRLFNASSKNENSHKYINQSSLQSTQQKLHSFQSGLFTLKNYRDYLQLSKDETKLKIDADIIRQHDQKITQAEKLTQQDYEFCELLQYALRHSIPIFSDLINIVEKLGINNNKNNQLNELIQYYMHHSPSLSRPGSGLNTSNKAHGVSC